MLFWLVATDIYRRGRLCSDCSMNSSLTTLSIMTLSIKGYFATFSSTFYCCVEYYCSVHHYYAECRYTECHGTLELVPFSLTAELGNSNITIFGHFSILVKMCRQNIFLHFKLCDKLERFPLIYTFDPCWELCDKLERLLLIYTPDKDY
jgi:hypothetical protein